MTSMPQTLSVAAIEHGTVIDHITAGNALKIIRLLSLPADDHQITVGLNLPSKLMGKKDLIKVEGKELTEEEVNEISILAPGATINIIKKYAVVKKKKVSIPSVIERIIRCPNPACITNHEAMTTRFRTALYKNRIQLQCYYCEKHFAEEEIHVHA